MNILIVGSKGFIGSHCVNSFKKRHSIWQCDVIVDYVTPDYFMVDATNANFDDIFRQQNFDICINCSGAASVPHSIENPQRDFTLNVFNIVRHLDAIRKYNPTCKYIHLSSAAVYGNPQDLPISEKQKMAPISPYGIHKKMAETLCKEYYEHFGVASHSFRIFSAYGSGLKKQLFWDLYKKQKNQGDIQLYGTGNESRDFVFIDDIIQALECVIENASFDGGSYNLASGKEIFIKEAVETFYGLFGNDKKVIFSGEQRKGDPNNWLANIDKLKALGYSPKYKLEEGLKIYALWLSILEKE